MWRTTFETPLDKVQNLLGVKLTTDVTLLFFFYVTGVDYEINSISEYFLC